MPYCFALRRRALAFALTGATVAALPLATRAADGRWTPFGPPTGELVELVADPFVSGTFYGLTLSDSPGGRVFRSRDGGQSWSFAGTGFAADASLGGLAADPLRRGVLYAAGLKGFYRSEDSAGHWTKVNGPSYSPYAPGTGGQLLLAAIPERRATTVLCATIDGILRSADGGRSWTSDPGEVGTRFLVTDLKPGPGGAGSVYRATYSGEIRRSLDGGRTWTVVWTPTADSVEALAIDPRQPAGLLLATRTELFRSADRGEHWNQVTTLPSAPDAAITALAFDRRAPRALYVARFGLGGNVLCLSRDRGTTWRQLQVPLQGATRRMWSDPASPQLYAASETALVWSPDFGTSWQARLEIGRPPGFFPPHLRFDPRDPLHLWFSAAGHLATSTDGGSTWRSVPVRVAESDILVYDALPDPARGNSLYAGSVIGLLRSRDTGKSWVRVEGPAFSPSLVALFPGAPGLTTILTGDSQLSRSPDGGETWQAVITASQGLPPGQSRTFRALFLNPREPQTLFLIADVFLFNPRPAVLHAETFRSRDGGATWTLLEDRETQIAFDPGDAQAAYRLDERGLFLSRNEGDTWTRLGDPPPRTQPGATISSLWLDPASGGTPARFYAVLNAGGVYRSTDEGATWQPANGGLALVPFPLTITGAPRVPHQLYLGTLESLLGARFPYGSLVERPTR
jgi:photosystem II stability/assembly factor-like uncharacterized protein